MGEGTHNQNGLSESYGSTLILHRKKLEDLDSEPSNCV